MPDWVNELPEFQQHRVQRWLARSDGPYLTLKAAATLDGRIATASGESQWITGEPARRLGQILRGLHDAVLVGVNTVLRDDPRLTVRLEGTTARPARIVLDSTCRSPASSRLFQDDGAQRLLIAGRSAPGDRVEALRALGVQVWRAQDGRPQAREFLPWLRRQGLHSILVEGGGQVHGHFVANARAQELFLFLSGLVLGDERAPAWCAGLHSPLLMQAARIRLSAPRQVGEDILIHGLFGE